MKRHIIIFIILFMSLWNHEASAFWGSGSKESDSGLDVVSGFDVNTITTLTGTVITPPARKGDGDHTGMSVSTTKGVVAVILGPWWYWEKQTITILKNQKLSITGSLAQGKDGALYLFVQRIENLSNGETVVLRSESGKSLWSGSSFGNQKGTRGGSRSGAGNRGGVGNGRR